MGKLLAPSRSAVRGASSSIAILQGNMSLFCCVSPAFPSVEPSVVVLDERVESIGKRRLLTCNSSRLLPM